MLDFETPEAKSEVKNILFLTPQPQTTLTTLEAGVSFGMLWCFLSSFIHHWTMIVGGSIIRLNHLWKCGKPNFAPRPKLMPFGKKKLHTFNTYPFLYNNKGPGPFSLNHKGSPNPSNPPLVSTTPLLPSNHKVGHKTPPNLAEVGHELWKCWSGIHVQNIIVTYILI